MNLKEFYETNKLIKCNVCSSKLGGYLVVNQIRKLCTNEQYLNDESLKYIKYHFFIDSMIYRNGRVFVYYFLNKIEDIEIFYKEFYNLDGKLLGSFIFNHNNILYFDNEYSIDQCKEKVLSLKLEFCHDTILSKKSIEKLKTLYLFG